MDRHPGLGIGHGPTPGTIPLCFGHLAGDVGDHRPQAQELPRGLRESGQGLEVDPEIDRTLTSLRGVLLSEKQLQ
jgi:hypothetical protein